MAISKKEYDDYTLIKCGARIRRGPTYVWWVVKYKGKRIDSRLTSAAARRAMRRHKHASKT